MLLLPLQPSRFNAAPWGAAPRNGLGQSKPLPRQLQGVTLHPPALSHERTPGFQTSSESASTSCACGSNSSCSAKHPFGRLMGCQRAETSSPKLLMINFVFSYLPSVFPPLLAEAYGLQIFQTSRLICWFGIQIYPCFQPISLLTNPYVCRNVCVIKDQYF